MLLTVLVVVLAGASHMEKLVLLFSARRAGGKKFGERLQAVLERYRTRPVRYFTIVVGTLVLLLAAGGCYIYLDADKRASERALGMLEFCHLALRTRDAQGVLIEQRHNLQAIESTAGDIRALVDKLPPEEQRKAHQIVATMNAALTQQGKLVGDYLNRSEETTTMLNQHTEALQRGLSSVEAGVLGLKSLPGGLHDSDLSVQKLDGQLGAFDAKLDGQSKTLGQLAALTAEVKALADCPAPVCPACVCGSKPEAHPPEATHDTPEAPEAHNTHDSHETHPPPVVHTATHQDAGAADHLAPSAEAPQK